jgi:hypothetical protein
MPMIALLRPVLAPAARRVLAGRFERREIRRILEDAFAGYRRLRVSIPAEKGIGGRLMVRLAALTACFYRALLERGLSCAEAQRRTADMTWFVYEKMAAVPWAVARVMERTAHGRVLRATALFRRFPFRPPSYEMVDAPAAADIVAFDVLRCPVAEYLRAQGLSSLCVEAWCELDVPLAARWGATLERTGTLAGGAARCDFRWRIR